MGSWGAVIGPLRAGLLLACIAMLLLCMVTFPASAEDPPIKVLDSSYPSPGMEIIDRTPAVVIEFGLRDGIGLVSANTEVVLDTTPITNFTLNDSALEFQVGDQLSIGLHTLSINFSLNPAGTYQYTIPFYIVDVQIPIVAIIQASMVDAPRDTEIIFDGKGSYDPLNRSLQYEWDFDYSGAFIKDMEGLTVSHSFSTVGPHIVAMRVNNGESFKVVTIEIYIYSTTLVPPVAIIRNEGNVVTGGLLHTNSSEVLILESSGSHDPDGHLISYKWYVNGKLVTSYHRFSEYLEPGTHVITLEVSDEYDTTYENLTVVVADTGAGAGTTSSGSSSVVAVIVVILIILVIVAAIVAILFIFVRPRTRWGGGDEEEDEEEEEDRPQRPTFGRRKEKDDDDPEKALAKAKARERKLSKELDQQNAALDKEMTTPFAGFRTFLGFPPKEQEEPADEEFNLPKRTSSFGTTRTTTTRTRTPRTTRKSSFSTTSSKEEEEEKPKRSSFFTKKKEEPEPEPKTRRTRRRAAASTSTPSFGTTRTSTTRSSKPSKKDLDDETSKMESFMSFPFAKKKEEPEPAPSGRSSRGSRKELDDETSKMESFMSFPFSKKSDSGEDDSRKSKDKKTRKELDAEMKRMEADMEKQLAGIMKK